MSIEDKVDRLASDFAEHRGESKQFFTNMTNWVTAVNLKVNGHFEEHKEEAKEKNKAGRDWWSIGMTGGLVLVGIIEITRIVRH